MENFKQNLIKSVALAKKKVETLRKEDSVVFPIFTDVHSMSADSERMEKLCCAMKLITEEISCDMAVDLGDNTGMLGRNLHISNSDLKKEIGAMLGKVYASVNCPLLVVHGNHDAVGTDFFKPEFWNDIVKYNYGNTDAVYDTAGAYYYVDVKKAKTRFVVLSVPCDSELDVEYPTPVWTFGNKQIEWLKNEALNVKGNVIILIHLPFYYRDKKYKTEVLEVWNGNKTAMSYITNLCGRIEDVEKAVEVINEFCARDDTKLVGCFSGHTHRDSLYEPFQDIVEDGYEYKNPLPCYQIVTTGAFVPESEHKDFGISIDLVVWTSSENKLDIIRIGDGEDRSLCI